MNATTNTTQIFPHIEQGLMNWMRELTKEQRQDVIICYAMDEDQDVMRKYAKLLIREFVK